MNQRKQMNQIPATRLEMGSVRVQGQGGMVHKSKREGKIVNRSLPLSQVYRLIEPGPVVMVTNSRKG